MNSEAIFRTPTRSWLNRLGVRPAGHTKQKGSDTFCAGPLEILEWKWMLSADQAANSVSFSLTAMAPLPMRSRR